MPNADITCPFLVRPGRRDILIEQVGRDIEGMIAVGGALVFPCSYGTNTVLFHQPADPPLADRQAQFLKFRRHAGTPIAAPGSGAAARGYAPAAPCHRAGVGRLACTARPATRVGRPETTGIAAPGEADRDILR